MFKKKKDKFIKIKNVKISVLSAFSYIIDWILYIILIIIFSVFRICTAPRYHEFALDDNRYAHTFYNDQFVLFANWVSFFISLIIPIIYIISQFTILSKATKVRKIWNVHCALLGFLAAQTFQVIIVSLLKNALGIPRPDMISRCMPSSFNLAPIGSLSNVSICVNPNIGVINDGFRSFPSGHASTAFCSSTYTFFIFATKNNIFEKRHPSYKILLGFLPFLISLFVTATRYSDNRHFLCDLIFGAKIGSFCAFIGYHLYFPWYKGCGCNKGNAFPPRRISWSKKDKFKFWKLPKDNDDDCYLYDSDAIDIEDDLNLEPFYSDEETSMGSASSGKYYLPKGKEIIKENPIHTCTSHQHTTNHHNNFSKQNKTGTLNKSRPTTQTTTYTIKMKDPECAQ